MAACTTDGLSVDDGGSTTDPGGTGSGTESGTGTETGTGTEIGTGDEPGCGNGILEVDEQCDDANAIDDDGCSNTCTARTCEPSWSLVDQQPILPGQYYSAGLHTGLAELPNGDIAVAMPDTTGNSGTRVRVYTPAGDVVSDHLLGPGWDFPDGLTADPSGDLFVAGKTGGADHVATIARLSGADASELWRFEVDGVLRPTELVLDDQGQVVVAFTTERDGGRWIEVHTLDPQTGASTWMAEWQGGANLWDFAQLVVYDAARARIWVAVTHNRGTDWWEPLLLAFDPPAVEPVLEVLPLDHEGDAGPDSDVAVGLTISASGRLWMANLEFEGDFGSTLISELDPADGSLIASYDVQALGLGFRQSRSELRSLVAQPQAGLAWVGFVQGSPNPDHSAMILLDDDAGIDCVVNTGEGRRLGHALAASDGGLYVAGETNLPDGLHLGLVRVR